VIDISIQLGESNCLRSRKLGSDNDKLVTNYTRILRNRRTLANIRLNKQFQCSPMTGLGWGFALYKTAAYRNKDS